MSLRRNNIQGTKKVTWGFLGKRNTYVNEGFKRLPELTEEERQQKLVDSLKPWSVSRTEARIDFAQAHGGTDAFVPPVSPSPTPTISLTPSITPSVTPTYTPTLTPTPTITPSVTPSVLITFYLQTAGGDDLQTAGADNILWTT